MSHVRFLVTISVCLSSIIPRDTGTYPARKRLRFDGTDAFEEEEEEDDDDDEEDDDIDGYGDEVLNCSRHVQNWP